LYVYLKNGVFDKFWLKIGNFCGWVFFVLLTTFRCYMYSANTRFSLMLWSQKFVCKHPIFIMLWSQKFGLL
jgi:hypothetical protein